MPVRSDLIFVAQWWPIVTFDANGGAWSSGETIETMHYVKIQTDTEIRRPTAAFGRILKTR